MSQSDQTPARYQPEPRPYEQKQWLYEQYWGQMKSMPQIADECGVAHRTIWANLRQHGIPRRGDGRRVNDEEPDPRVWFETDESESVTSESTTVDWSTAQEMGGESDG